MKNINTKLILILFLILIIILLIYYIYNYNIYNNILLLKFVDYNNNEKIITKYPEKNYPDKYKIKLYNIIENIIPIPYNNIDNFTLCYGDKGPDGLDGSSGPRGKEEDDGLDGLPGPRGKSAVNKKCNSCKDGKKGIKGEKGNLVKLYYKNDNNNTLKIIYDDENILTTENLKGEKGIKPQKQEHHRGDRGPTGPAALTLSRNHKLMHLQYINIQIVKCADPWIYTLANNCVMIAMINNAGYKKRQAIFIKEGNNMRKLGYPDKKYDIDNDDGGDYSGLVAIAIRDNGSIKFRLDHSILVERNMGNWGGEYSIMAETMTVVSFWWD